MPDLKEEQKVMDQGLSSIQAKPLTLNPEEELPALKEPALGTISSPIADTAFTAGSTDETMLTEQEKKQVEEFVKQIDISDVKVLNSYGSSAQKGISTDRKSVV